jgi:hypothetical protein
MHCTASVSTSMSMAMATVTAVAVIAHMRTMLHHGRPIAVWVSHGICWSHSLRKRIGAPEAGCAALEVGEAARRAGPIPRTRSILAGREGCKDVSGTVENAAGGWRNLDGFLVEGTTIHA